MIDRIGRRLGLVALAAFAAAPGCGRSEVYPTGGGSTLIGKSLSIVAGQPGGAGSANGIGAAARFNTPAAVVADGAGNVYVADSGNGTIRKLVLETGAVTTLAGAARYYGSADGAGAAARFSAPLGLAYDGAGSLYVADSDNDTIRQIALATGAVTTLAGAPLRHGSADGTGAAAGFDFPSGLAYEGAASLYVADALNCTIRQIALTTSEVTTLAGTAGHCGSADGVGAVAGFHYPTGLATDRAGNLYVADTSNDTIRKIVLAAGAVTTIAGTAGLPGSADGAGAAARFSQPTGLTYDGAGNLYVADTGNSTIRKIALATATVTTLTGTAGQAGSADGVGAAAGFYYPWGLATDGAGGIYVADTGNDMIRSIVAATTAVTTLAGTAGQWGGVDGIGAEARFDGPCGLATDQAGTVYVGDWGNNTIRQIVIATGALTTLAGTPGQAGRADGVGPAASFDDPYGLATDGAGNLYVADSVYSTIRQIVLATGTVTTLAGSAGQWGNADGTGAAARFAGPSGLAYDGAGNLYVADSGNDEIRRIVLATRAVTTLASTDQWSPSFGLYSRPAGLAYDGAGNLYVSDTWNDTILEIVVATGAMTTLAGTAGQRGSADGAGPAASFNDPEALAYDGAGNLFVADTGNSTVREIALATAQVTTVIGVAGDGIVVPGPIAQARLAAPAGLAMGANGALFISDIEENVVLEAQ